MKSCLFLFSLIFFYGAIYAQSVEDPWVSTDRTVDCSSLESIIKGVIKEGMTEEEKSIAMYNFFRQRVYHYSNLPESRDPLKTLNTIGHTLCGSQATCMKGLLAAAGIKARVVSHPGHTFYEAFYDDKWHGYDTFANFYVKTRGDKPNVASYEELAKDHSLVADAEKEGRANPNWVPCGDSPMAFTDPIKITDYTPSDYKYDVKKLSLRNGEEIIRSWWPTGEPLKGSFKSSHKTLHHTCGSKDRKNPYDLFKFWEPYGIPNFGIVSISYRHYFNGFLNFSPDLTSSVYKEALDKKELVLPVDSPYYITGGVLYFKANNASEGDSIVVSVNGVNKKWENIVTANDKGERQYRVDLSQYISKSGAGLHHYDLKFALSGSAQLTKMYLRTVFQHNAMSAPHLMPGKNVVTVSTKTPDNVDHLTLTYRYKDAPSWGQMQVLEKKIDKSPYTFTVELPETEKLPQMHDLTLKNGQLNWFPELDLAEDKTIAEFIDEASVQAWGADKPLGLAFADNGMVISCTEKTSMEQASLQKLTLDISKHTKILISIENLATTKQTVLFRARSNGENAQRTDIEKDIGPGKKILWEITTKSLVKTKLDNIDKIYFMILNAPDTGCKIKINKIWLEADKSL